MRSWSRLLPTGSPTSSRVGPGPRGGETGADSHDQMFDPFGVPAHLGQSPDAGRVCRVGGTGRFPPLVRTRHIQLQQVFTFSGTEDEQGSVTGPERRGFFVGEQLSGAGQPNGLPPGIADPPEISMTDRYAVATADLAVVGTDTDVQLMTVAAEPDSSSFGRTRDRPAAGLRHMEWWRVSNRAPP